MLPACGTALRHERRARHRDAGEQFVKARRSCRTSPHGQPSYRRTRCAEYLARIGRRGDFEQSRNRALNATISANVLLNSGGEHAKLRLEPEFELSLRTQGGISSTGSPFCRPHSGHRGRAFQQRPSTFCCSCCSQLIVLAARGESHGEHRGRRGAPRTRRDDREYRSYLKKEQRSPRGCIAGRMPA
jgi:hypothetical protein